MGGSGYSEFSEYIETGTMKGISADSGRELWSAPHDKSGYRSPEDLIVAGGKEPDAILTEFFDSVG